MAKSPEREVQKRLLNEAPRVPGIDIEVSWKPFGDVGGDFYDIFPIEEEAVAVCLGDISGKGYDAALLMVFALAELRSMLREHFRLPYIMSQLDASLKDFTSNEKFAEVLVGAYVPSIHRFVFVQGGGISPVVFRSRTERLEFYGSSTYRVPGMALPAGPGRHFAEDSVELEQGDLMLLFSDGVGERVDADGKEIVRPDDLELGIRTAPSLKKLCESNARGSAEEILQSVIEYLGSLESDPSDDETLIVIKAE